MFYWCRMPKPFMVYRTTRFTLALFWPVKRAFRPKGGKWEPRWIAGMNLGWFGWRVTWPTSWRGYARR